MTKPIKLTNEQMRPGQEVEKHLREHGHLPDTGCCGLETMQREGRTLTDSLNVADIEADLDDGKGTQVWDGKAYLAKAINQHTAATWKAAQESRDKEIAENLLETFMENDGEDSYIQLSARIVLFIRNLTKQHD